MDYLQYAHSGKIWRSCPTAGEGDCFFHSVFGTRDCDDELFRDKYAKRRRLNWSMFLTHHSYEGPTGALLDVLSRCFAANDSYQHRRIDNPEDYIDYANAVAGSGYWVLLEEIPVLATLENVKIILFRDTRAEPMVFEPNLELLGDFLSRNISEIGEVAICLVNGHFSRLNLFEQPIAISLVDKSNSVKELVTAIAEEKRNSVIAKNVNNLPTGIKRLNINNHEVVTDSSTFVDLDATTQGEFKQKELINSQGLIPREMDQVKLNYSNPKKRYEKLGCAGIEGSLYQIDLLTLVLLNGMQKVKNWRLSTEDKAAAQLDDLIFEHLPSESAILLQAKHKKDERKEVTYKDLLSVNKNSEFSLPKYFFSYQEVMCNFKVEHVIICTNLRLNEKTKSVLKEEKVNSYSVLHFEGAENICYGFSGCSLPELKQNIKKYYAVYVKNTKIVISDEDIDDFLNHLKLFPNCLGDKHVEYIVEQTTARLRFSEKLNSKMIQTYVKKKMMDWFKEERGRYLTEVDAKAFFCDLRSNKYCEDLKRYDIRFKGNNLPVILQTQQQKSKDKGTGKKGKKRRQQNENEAPVKDPKRISHIIPDKEYVLNVVKIYQALPPYHKDKTLVVNPEEGFEVQRQIIDAFEVQHYTILVIVCPNNQIEEPAVKGTCDKIMKLLNTHTYKRVILIAGKENNFATQLKEANIDWYEVIIDNITYADLEESTQVEFKRKKLINFQGNSMSLEELFTPTSEDNLNQIVNSEMILKFARGDEIEVGLELPHPDNYYISRIFNKKGQNVYEENLWRSTEVSKENAILISDSAGMGKSSVLTSLGVSIKKDNPHLWVVRIDLRNYTNIMRTILAAGRKTIGIIELVNSQETSKLKTEFGKKLFTTPNRIVLMLDGMDEISPTYTELVINLIRNSLAQVNLAKLFVTTRPHMSKDLEEISQLHSVTLEPFSKHNQIDFLRSYWTENLHLQDDARKGKCTIFAEALIEVMSNKWIEEYKNNFAGIPLQTRMLAEIFQEKSEIGDEQQEWEGCKEFVSSNNLYPKLPTRINLSQLYEMFINKKREIFIKNNNPSGHPLTDELLKDQFEKCQEYHRALALKVIFDSYKRLHLFACYTNAEWPIPSKLEDNVLFRVGIVQRQQGSIEFLHRTFAEYYVVNCLLIELAREPINEEFQQFFMTSILLKDEYYEIRAFLNSCMQNVWHLIEDNFCKYFRRNCISEKSLTKYFDVCAMEGCAENFKCLVKCIDKEQHNILSIAVNELHIMHKALSSAVQYGHLNILKFLLELNATFNKGKDAHKQFLASVFIYTYTSDTFKFFSRKVDEIDENILRHELHETAFMGQFGKVELWVEKVGTGININCNICAKAAYRGTVSMSQLEVAKGIGADINAEDQHGETAIYKPASQDKLEMVKYLVEEAKVDINVKDNKGKTALYTAASQGKLETVRYLVEEAGADVKVKDKKGETALYIAASQGELEIVKYLVEEAKVDINVKDNKGKTALYIAASQGKLEIVRYLVKEAGADVMVKDKNGETALYIAASQGELEIVKYLVEEAKVDINVKDKKGETARYIATSQGEIEIVKYLVEEAKVDINVKDKKGETALYIAASQGEFEIVKYLVEEAKVDINVKDNKGKTALYIAASQGEFEIVRYLVAEAGADTMVKDNKGKTALYIAASQGEIEIVKYLVEEAKVDINVKDKKGETARYIATSQGEIEIVKYLVEEAKVDINVKDKKGETALYIAASQGEFEIVKYLVAEAGADIKVKENKGKTALHAAAYWGEFKIVKYLVEEAEADISVEDNSGETVFHKAAYLSNLEILKYLVEAGVDIMVKDDKGKTALHIAASHADLEIVKFLVEEAGADVEDKENKGKTALYIAASRDNFEIVKYLVEAAGADINVNNCDGETAFHRAANFGNFDILKYLVEAGGDITVKDNKGKTALHIAASRGELKIVRYLVEEVGADVKAKDNKGETALHAAAYWGKLKIVKYLVEEATTDINVKNCDGETPLNIAASRNELKIVKYLGGEAGANRMVKDESALHTASIWGELEEVEYLVENPGAEINVKNSDGEMALHRAAYEGKLEKVRYLVEQTGVDMNVRDNLGKTALYIAASRGEIKIVKYLVGEAGADITIKQNNGKGVLHTAASRGELRVVRYLVEEAGADITAKDNKGETALHKAASQDELKIVKCLLEQAGVDINVKRNDGKTALHMAAYEGNLEMVKYLVKVGADVNVKNNDGETALHIAADGGRSEIVDYLVEEAGADVNIRDNLGMMALGSYDHRYWRELANFMSI